MKVQSWCPTRGLKISSAKVHKTMSPQVSGPAVSRQGGHFSCTCGSIIIDSVLKKGEVTPIILMVNLVV